MDAENTVNIWQFYDRALYRQMIPESQGIIHYNGAI